MNDQEVIQKIGKNNLINLKNAIETGHFLGLSYIDQSDIFKVPSAMSFRQNIVNFAIDLILEDCCKNNRIDFDFLYSYNQAKNCQHIELHRNDFKLTHSSGNYCNFPRRAIFREKLCTNQLSLFEDTNYNMEYGILMHSSNLKPMDKPLIGLGVPDSNCRDWCNYIDLKLIEKSEIIEIVTNDFDKEKFDFMLKQKAEKIRNKV